MKWWRRWRAKQIRHQWKYASVRANEDLCFEGKPYHDFWQCQRFYEALDQMSDLEIIRASDSQIIALMNQSAAEQTKGR